ncbi:pantothenate kinase [Cronbergia sp. UHCC 0137]|uniref:pantothenate kinase n=1 Tax=Cronbergia sp. UHCC 0137 TaxID=3110239 RepID=UPI002B1FE613|nr:pantothenate kinase [Cronbergia sp. UHCC 0137]MEA5618300.1 pantothenate kinase [Cronbergia sp. UHCC 0137]
MNANNAWLALMIGNSRLHWGLFHGKTLQLTWDTDHLPDYLIEQIIKCQIPADFPDSVAEIPSKLVLASVVPTQTALWTIYPKVHLITLDQIPLKQKYTTLGSDRALAVWGAGKTLGFPILVIDAGTAMTFTGADANQCLVGGAILPGLGLQFSSLGQKTGQLPLLKTNTITNLPRRFALNTPESIQSGIIYTILAGIKDFSADWLTLFPESKIVITGGDRTLLKTHLQTQFPEIAKHLIVEQNLIFWGIEKVITDMNFPCEVSM